MAALPRGGSEELEQLIRQNRAQLPATKPDYISTHGAARPPTIKSVPRPSDPFHGLVIIAQPPRNPGRACCSIFPAPPPCAECSRAPRQVSLKPARTRRDKSMSAQSVAGRYRQVELWPRPAFSCTEYVADIPVGNTPTARAMGRLKSDDIPQKSNPPDSIRYFKMKRYRPPRAATNVAYLAPYAHRAGPEVMSTPSGPVSARAPGKAVHLSLGRTVCSPALSWYQLEPVSAANHHWLKALRRVLQDRWTVPAASSWQGSAGHLRNARRCRPGAGCVQGCAQTRDTLTQHVAYIRTEGIF